MSNFVDLINRRFQDFVDMNIPEKLQQLHNEIWEKRTRRHIDNINDVMSDFNFKVQRLISLDKFEELAKFQQNCVDELNKKSVSYTQELLNEQLSFFQQYTKIFEPTTSNKPKPKETDKQNEKSTQS